MHCYTVVPLMRSSLWVQSNIMRYSDPIS
uniref:Uncharacterized protein n=1 Tax=Arundo donax TaxID=35708 RepID=A0A0A9GN07_ARUDO